MARIAGVNIPDNKHIVISLRYVYGIGPTTASAICDKTGIAPNSKTGELSPEELDTLRNEIGNLTTLNCTQSNCTSAAPTLELR